MHVLTVRLAQASIHELAYNGPMQKGQLVARTGASTMSVTGHLRQLEELGVVVADVPSGERSGKRVQYSVSEGAVLESLNALRGYLLPATSTGDR